VKFCEGETLNIQLPEDDNINYLWYDGSTAADRIFTNPGIYWLEFSDSCFNYMDTMYVGGCRTDILMPNIFSPNGDGFNDFFAPDFISNISKARVQIYDRWGKVIFETEDILEGWDGTHKGTLCQAENYIWYIDALAFDGKEYIFYGNVVLIR
jgi:gliding motility-associated-like protein